MSIILFHVPVYRKTRLQVVFLVSGLYCELFSWPIVADASKSNESILGHDLF